MKTNNEMTKKAKSNAFKMLYSFNNLRFGKIRSLDMRFNINKLTVKFIKENQVNGLEKSEILSLQKERRNRQHFENKNYLSNNITVDYLNNRNSIKIIHEDHIEFYGRNHWAKSQTDMNILKVLKKHFVK